MFFLLLCFILFISDTFIWKQIDVALTVNRNGTRHKVELYALRGRGFRFLSSTKKITLFSYENEPRLLLFYTDFAINGRNGTWVRGKLRFFLLP